MLKFEEHISDIETAIKGRIKVFENAWRRSAMPQEKQGMCEKVWEEVKNEYEAVEEKKVKELFAKIIQAK